MISQPEQTLTNIDVTSHGKKKKGGGAQNAVSSVCNSFTLLVQERQGHTLVTQLLCCKNTPDPVSVRAALGFFVCVLVRYE